MFESFMIINRLPSTLESSAETVLIVSTCYEIVLCFVSLVCVHDSEGLSKSCGTIGLRLNIVQYRSITMVDTHSIRESNSISTIRQYRFRLHTLLHRVCGKGIIP